MQELTLDIIHDIATNFDSIDVLKLAYISNRFFNCIPKVIRYDTINSQLTTYLTTSVRNRHALIVEFIMNKTHITNGPVEDAFYCACLQNAGYVKYGYNGIDMARIILDNLPMYINLDLYCYSIFEHACDLEVLEIVKFLLSRINPDLFSEFCSACHAGRCEIAEFLFDYLMKYGSYGELDERRYKIALEIAGKIGSVKIMKSCIDKVEQIPYRALSTCLFNAGARNHFELISYIISEFSDVDITGITYVSFQRMNMKVIALLFERLKKIKHGRPINHAIAGACESTSSTDNIIKLIERIISIDDIHADISDAVYNAVCGQNYKLVEYLISIADRRNVTVFWRRGMEAATGIGDQKLIDRFVELGEKKVTYTKFDMMIDNIIDGNSLK